MYDRRDFLVLPNFWFSWTKNRSTANNPHCSWNNPQQGNAFLCTFSSQNNEKWARTMLAKLRGCVRHLKFTTHSAKDSSFVLCSLLASNCSLLVWSCSSCRPWHDSSKKQKETFVGFQRQNWEKYTKIIRQFHTSSFRSSHDFVPLNTKPECPPSWLRVLSAR